MNQSRTSSAEYLYSLGVRRLISPSKFSHKCPTTLLRFVSLQHLRLHYWLGRLLPSWPNFHQAFPQIPSGFSCHITIRLLEEIRIKTLCEITRNPHSGLCLCCGCFGSSVKKQMKEKKKLKPCNAVSSPSKNDGIEEECEKYRTTYKWNITLSLNTLTPSKNHNI